MEEGVAYITKRAVLVSLPEGEIEESDDILVKRPAESFIVFRRDPFFAQILKSNWVDVSKLDKEPERVVKMSKYFGAYQNSQDIEEQQSVFFIAEKYWTSDPAKDKSFYGIIRYVDLATPSDLIKNKSLINKDDSVDNWAVNLQKQHIGYYLSWPVEEIIHFDCIDKIAEACLDSSPNEKSAKIFDYLNLWKL